jgi:hypothetical protein
MVEITDLPDNLIEKIASHLRDSRGLVATCKQLRAGVEPEIQSRLNGSVRYFDAMRIVCNSRRVLLRHAYGMCAFCRNEGCVACLPDEGEGRYTCSMCGRCIRQLGGCSRCRTLIHDYPFMITWHKACPTYVVRILQLF